MTKHPWFILWTLAIMLLSSAGGCATATVAAAGTMAGIAVTAVSTGSDVYGMGKLSSADMADFQQWKTAARAAAEEDLQFKIESEADTGDGRWRCTFVDDRNTRVRIHVDRRTETLLRIQIDVGLFGSEPTARLLLARIRYHLELQQPTTRQSAGATIPSSRPVSPPMFAPPL